MKVDKREELVFNKYVGAGEVSVLAFNPTVAQLDKLLSREVKEDREEIEYVKEDVTVKYKKDGEEKETVATRVNIDAWVKEKSTSTISKIRFMLTNFPAYSYKGEKTKVQYINCLGQTTWIPLGEEDNLPQWFTHFTVTDRVTKAVSYVPKDYREAKMGEGELYDFLAKWTNINPWNTTQSIFVDNTKKFWRGDMSELNSLIPIFEDQTVILQFGVRTVTTTDEQGNEVTNEYQSIFNKAFCQGSLMNKFNFHKRNKFEGLSSDKNAYNLNKFIEAIKDEQYGFKDFTVLDNFQVYNPDLNPLNNEAAIVESDSAAY